MKVEYKVRPVTRFIVTRYKSETYPPESKLGSTGTSEVKGEFDNFKTAHAVAYALAKQEAFNLNLSPLDDTVIYPDFVAKTQAMVFTAEGHEYAEGQPPDVD